MVTSLFLDYIINNFFIKKNSNPLNKTVNEILTLYRFPSGLEENKILLLTSAALVTTRVITHCS